MSLRGGLPESPSVVRHGNPFYLFWCIWDEDDVVNSPYANRTFVFRSDTPFEFKEAPQIARLSAHVPEIVRDENGDWVISSVEWPHRGVSIAPLTWE